MSLCLIGGMSISGNDEIKIRAMEQKDFEPVIELGRKLKISDDDSSGWFTEDACEKHIPFDIKFQRGFVAEDGGRIIGFITYTSYDYQPIIGWIAIDPFSHRKGVGTILVKKVEEEVEKIGGDELFVETPTKEAGIGSEYEKTYKFYEGIGFIIHRIKKKNEPDNQCGCDMAVLKKVLK